MFSGTAWGSYRHSVIQSFVSLFPFHAGLNSYGSWTRRRSWSDLISHRRSNYSHGTLKKLRNSKVLVVTSFNSIFIIYNSLACRRQLGSQGRMLDLLRQRPNGRRPNDRAVFLQGRCGSSPSRLLEALAYRGNYRVFPAGGLVNLMQFMHRAPTIRQRWSARCARRRTKCRRRRTPGASSAWRLHPGIGPRRPPWFSSCAAP